MSLTSLRETVLAIVEEMLAEAKDISEDHGAVYAVSTLKGYAKQLKIACKAAGEEVPLVPAPVNGLSISPGLMPQTQHALEIEKARAEFRKRRDGVTAEERHGGDMVQVVGGPACPDEVATVQSIDPSMPLGARMVIAGGVYRLIREDVDGKPVGKRLLIFDEPESQRVAKELTNQKQLTPETSTWDEVSRKARRGGVL